MSKSNSKRQLGTHIRLVLGVLFLISSLLTLFLYFELSETITENNSLPKQEEQYRLKLAFEAQLNVLQGEVSKTSGLVHEFNSYGGSKVVINECGSIWSKSIKSCTDSLKKLIDIKADFLSKQKARLLKEGYEFSLLDAVYSIQNTEFEIFNNWQGGWTQEDGVRLENISKDISFLNETSEKLLKHFDVKAPELTESQVPYSLWVVGILLLVIALIFVGGGFVLKGAFVKPIIRLESAIEDLSNGEVSEKIEVQDKEYQKLEVHYSKLTDNLKNIRKIALEVGRGAFDHEIKVFDDKGELGSALAQMRESLKKVAREDQQRNKVNEGLAKFSEILGNYTNDLSRFGDEVIFNLVKFLDANQGGVFTVTEDEEQVEYLELIACYAYDKKKYINKKIRKGQGLVGQVWQEGKKVYLTEVPDNYVNITSGLGYSNPRCILIVPLNFNDSTHGVIELASFRELETFELEFIDKAAESIASALASVKVNDRTQKLLAESKELTEQMRAQEEEMRQNMEELQATQEEMQRREEERIKEIEELKKKLKNRE